jgi:hypothetical protein
MSHLLSNTQRDSTPEFEKVLCATRLYNLVRALGLQEAPARKATIGDGATNQNARNASRERQQLRSHSHPLCEDAVDVVFEKRRALARKEIADTERCL